MRPQDSRELVKKLFPTHAKACPSATLQREAVQLQGQGIHGKFRESFGVKILPMPNSPCGHYGYYNLIAALAREVKNFFQN